MEKHKNIIPGLAIFICAIAFLLFLAAPIQNQLGLLGLGITEIGLLAISLVGALLLKGNFKEIFPIKRLSFKAFRGSAYIYIGIYCFTIGVSNLLLYLFPGMGEVNSEIYKFLSEGGILLLITVSLLPGICEEALFRGTIQSSFGGLKSTVAVVCIIGVLFGLFHLDIYRFLPSMILGMGFTYIMLKTGNLLYSAFFHALNNLIPILPILLGSVSVGITAPEMSATMLTGIIIVFVSLGLLFLRLGIRRLNNKNAGEEGRGKRIVFTVICVALAITGLVVVGIGTGLTAPETNIATPAAILLN
jgi:membrane protease YdiL (CAAX protease family)